MSELNNNPKPTEFALRKNTKLTKDQNNTRMKYNTEYSRLSGHSSSVPRGPFLLSRTQWPVLMCMSAMERFNTCVFGGACQS